MTLIRRELEPRKPTPIEVRTPEVYAKMGCSGMTSAKSFGILVGAKGEGTLDRVIRTSVDRERQTLPLIDNDQEGLGSTKPTPIEVEALKSTPIWDALG
jgi:hypothetical protein